MLTVEQIQQTVSSYFATKPVLRAYLFGSYARGEADEQSDVDVLVDLDYANNGASFNNYCQMLDDLNEQLGIKVDIVSSNGLSRFIKPYIDEDKILIYEKTNG